MSDGRRASQDILQEYRYYGKYRGRVVDNADPLSIGRVQVVVPAIYPDEPLGWALPCVPYAGDGTGLYLIPEPDTAVWVEFEGGDLSRPIWTGCFWGSGQLPEGAEPGVFILKTTGGHLLQLSDKDETIQLTHSGGATLVVTGDDITIEYDGKKIVISGSAVTINDGSLEVT